MNIELPNDWDCMEHQKPLWQYLSSGGKRAVALWHRRAGKDSTGLNYTAAEAMSKAGVYWHMLPTQRQARKVVWDGIDRQGRRMVDQVFPKEIRKATRVQEMQIELKSGSIWQLCGSDNYDALVGANPTGVIFSEWSLCNPAAWDFIRPILAENGGWALFIYTARGKNHGYDMAEMARENPKWFFSKLTADDTKRPDGTPIITEEAIQDDREAGMSEDMIQQEYYCSFDVAIQGAYFAAELASARADKRVGFLPVDPSLQVHTFWDLGINDAMTIWFVQATGKEIRLINYYENNNFGMAHYIDYLNKFKVDQKCHYGEHYAPHDIKVRELMSGKSRQDTAREMGINFRVVKQHRVIDGIEAVRRLFPRFWFDDSRCARGIDCIASYHREFSEKDGVYKDAPVHDWASHGADSLRMLAMGWHERLNSSAGRKAQVVQSKVGFNVFE
jgi:hypothetical protein